ncbi:MAG TPA: hemerythrin domain-containing protein [Elusimicrobiota bacterium]|nr:hemerythrin domain-containing protein [Elusimicrobiota bacterium]
MPDATMKDPQDALASFARDHRGIDSLVLGGRFKPAAERLADFKEFDRRLERHIRCEEDILFPALARRGEQWQNGPIRVMLEEHKDIRAHKAAALAALERGDLEMAARHEKILFPLLSHHNAKEEQVLYPACAALLETQDALLAAEKLANSENMEGTHEN